MGDCAHYPSRTTSSLIPCLRDSLAPNANHAHRCRCASLVETPQPSPHRLHALRAPAAPFPTCCTARGGGPPASVCPGCDPPTLQAEYSPTAQGEGYLPPPDHAGHLSAVTSPLRRSCYPQQSSPGETSWMSKSAPGRDSPASPRSPARRAPASCNLLSIVGPADRGQQPQWQLDGRHSY